jgi:hypothetical protein
MSERGWTLARAGLLIGAVALLSPISPVLLVFVPLALLLVAFRSRDWMAVAVAVVILAMTFGDAGTRSGEVGWLVQRGWALILGGAFVAATAVTSRAGLFRRSLMAVALALGTVVVLGSIRPALLVELDWWMSGEIRQAATVANDFLASFPGSGDEAVRVQFAEAVYGWMGFQQQVYPAFLALSSLAALGVAWFAFGRLSGVMDAIAPLRDFRFSDQLVWLLVGGLALLVLPLGGFAFRVGENAALFMAMLYLLRGIGIMIWVGAAVLTSAWAGWLLTLAAVLLYPVAAGTAFVLGLSDTWLDLRGRLARAGTENGDS